MINLKKITQNKASALVEAVDTSANVAEARAMFGDKTFQEANKGSKTFASWIATIAQVVSAVLASSYFYFKIALPALPFEVPYLKEGIAVLLSLLILGILEILKKQLFQALFISFYKSKSKAVSFKAWLIPICALLTLISIYTSFEGAKLYVSQSDKSGVIAINYQNQIADIEKQEKQFRNSISWKGKIDTYNKTNAKLLAGFQDRKNALYEAQSKEIGMHKGDIESKGYSVAIFSLFMEILAVTCFWFICYVNFYTFVESKESEKTTEEVTPTVTSVVSNVGAAQPISGNSAPYSKKIGFSFNGVQPVESTVTSVVTQNVLKEGNRICLHCGDAYEYKIYNQKYCTEKCRVEAWQIKTGKTLTVGKKGGKNNGK